MSQRHAADSNPVVLPVETVVAHDAAVNGTVGGMPVVMAAVAETPADTDPANQVSADGDAVRLKADRDGALFTHPYPPRIWSFTARYTAAQTNAVVKAAPSAGLSLYVRTVDFSTEGATTRMFLEESQTTTVWSRSHPAATAGNIVLDPPIKLGPAKGLDITTTGTSATMDVFISGFTAP